MFNSVQVILSEIAQFISWWVYFVPKNIFLGLIGYLAHVDDNLRLRENARLWFRVEPMFGDYTLTGRLVGWIFRGIRMIVSVIVFLVVAAMHLVVLVGWYILPIGALYLLLNT